MSKVTPKEIALPYSGVNINSHQVKAEANAKIAFDVCCFLSDFFNLFFNVFAFASSFDRSRSQLGLTDYHEM